MSPPTSPPLPERLLILGLGYCGSEVARQAQTRGIHCSATRRDVQGRIDGVEVWPLGTQAPGEGVMQALAQADALLCTLPPDALGDPAARALGACIEAAPRLRWLGYLSSTGVYAERGGGVVDPAHPADAKAPMAVQRLLAEAQWRALAQARGIDSAVFRLAGIYGPGRNVLEALAEGSARHVHAPGVLFNRVHVHDIARAVLASMQRPCGDALYLLADNQPAEPSEVLAYAANISGLPLPEAIPLDDARVSPGLRRFYQSSKRIDARLSWQALGVEPRYPDFRAGLDAIWKARQTAEP